MLLEAGAGSPNVTILGAGAPVQAVVYVSLACFGIAVLWFFYPFMKRWAERPREVALPVVGPPPGQVTRVETCLTRDDVREIVVDALADHFDKTHDDVRKIVSQEVAPLQRIAESTHAAAGKTEMVTAGLQHTVATGLERQSASSRLVEQIAQKVADAVAREGVIETKVDAVLSEVRAVLSEVRREHTNPGR